ncbi:MAG: DUF2804 domain-containing protein [Anaerovoracaceae bacterium]
MSKAKKQHKLSPGKLLNEKGELKEAGYATSLIKEYNIKDVKVGPHRIKEWDYYLINNDKYAFALTLASAPFVTMASVTLIDFEKKEYQNAGVFVPKGLKFPQTSEDGDLEYINNKFHIRIKNNKGKRVILCNVNKFGEETKADTGENLTLKKKVSLTAYFIMDKPEGESMVIATPFKDAPKHFYYNHKINCIKTSGEVLLGNERIKFSHRDSLSVLDWGRGVWTYENTWYWGSISTYINGVPFGLNLGYGFGDTSAATENMIFYDGVSHKTDKVKFNIPRKMKLVKEKNDKKKYIEVDDYTADWKITSNDDRINIDFKPIIDRNAVVNLLLIETRQHQVFGRLYGEVVLDDGKKVKLNGEIGFFEKVKNRW